MRGPDFTGECMEVVNERCKDLKSTFVWAELGMKFVYVRSYCVRGSFLYVCVIRKSKGSSYFLKLQVRADVFTLKSFSRGRSLGMSFSSCARIAFPTRNGSFILSIEAILDQKVCLEINVEK